MSEHRAKRKQSPLAYSSVILDTLENLISPGGRARLSPYVEAAQIQVLFDETVDPKSHHRSTAHAINQNKVRIQSLARIWGQFCNAGKKFSAEIYADSDFLEAYLIYYFSVNVAKLQVTLLDLLRAGELQKETWHVMDIGVGVGTTIVALADFLLTWQTVCDLYQTPFPVKNVLFAGVDKNEAALDFSNNMIRAYTSTLHQSEERSDHVFRLNLIVALEKVNWFEIDLEHAQELPNAFEPNLLVASNVFNELNRNGQTSLAELIKNLAEGCTALVIEPGDERRAKALMSWRKKLVDTCEFSSQGPCEVQNNRDVSCQNCWNARRQSFHQTTLYHSFRIAALEFVDDRRNFDEFENNLLSWSAIWVTRGRSGQQAEPIISITPGDNWPDDFPLRYIGRYTGKANNGLIGPVGYDPDEFRAEQVGGWKEYIKFCPASMAEKGLTVVREPGFQFPNLRYGQQVKITRSQLAQVEPEVLKINLTPDSQVIPLEEQSKHSDSFLSDYQDSSRSAIDEIALRLFGFDGMHSFQHRILARVLTGRSILGIAATGSGKSECFILPAILLPGLTVVVSPLISLMMDQYDQRICERYGLNHLVTYINGQVKFIERQARLRRMELGYYKLVYFTPEQLERGYVLDSLRRANENVGVRYLAMDEAHCISQWGHDFRPSYLNLSRRFESHGMQPVRIALTATASPFVRQDICEELGLNPVILEEGGDVFVESSNRPELNLVVRVKQRNTDKVEDILSDLKGFLLENQDDQAPGAAIVFMPHTGGNPENIRRTKSSPNSGRLSAGVTPFAAFLERKLQQPVSIYHSKIVLDEPASEADPEDNWKPGDMTGRSRRGEQQRFISDQTQIMVATKGFGMGIDKDNIRLIIHRTPPSNLEAYAQEAGRAGRDGFPADVILYYSPDPAEDETEFGGVIKVPSDYEIQEFFLSDKYIRRIDVIVMQAFLKSIKPVKGGNIYFTNDQAIEFLDRCVHGPQSAGLPYFEWPEFQKREPSGLESEDHAEILERGHLYQEKSNYINRILQALYRIRPTFDGNPRLPFLEQVHETGASIIAGRILNSQAIFESNAYFGKLLRSSDIDNALFDKFVRDGSLIPLAELLGLSIRETANMLYDIRNAESRFVDGVWKTGLLDFKFIAAPRLGPAAGRHDLNQWREYSGAYRRASRRIAYQRAANNHRPVIEYYDKRQRKTIKAPFPTLDDWFYWKEMNKSTGWEITPGAAFSSQVDFKRYLPEFMSLHDKRETNDWASYQRLLSDYVGVNENGSLKWGDKDGDCLRAVLLGYLETYEVVTGDSCYSCSRCVPDGNFGRISLEQRLSAVVRMSPRAIEGFDRLKNSADQFPNREQVDDLFAVINADEKAGRSLRGYFSGWSARLLDQNPDHKAAIWLRFEGMARGEMQFQAREFLGYIGQILDGLLTERYPYFETLLNMQDEALSGNPTYYELKAKFYHLFDKPTQEADALQSLVAIQTKNGSSTQSSIYKSATRLVELFDASGPLADDARYTRFTCLAARTASAWQERLSRYRPIASSWSWAQILQEMEKQVKYPEAEELHNALCCAWLESDFTSRAEQALSWLLERPERVLAWPEPIKEKILEHYPHQVILGSNALTENYVLEARDRQQVCKLGLVSLAHEGELSQQALKRLVVDLQEQLNSTNTSLATYLPEPQQRQRVIGVLVPLMAELDGESVDYWLQYFLAREEFELEVVKPLVLQAIAMAAHDQERYEAVLRLQEMLVPAYLDDDVQELIIKVWMPLYSNSPKVLSELLKRIALKNDPRGIALSDALFEASLSVDTKRLIPALLNNLPLPRWELARQLLVNLKRFSELAGLRLERNQLTGEDLRSLKDLFTWQTDLEEADMLATVLAKLRERLNPNWKTPLAMLVEVLVVAGRVDVARRFSQGELDLFIYHNGRRFTLEQFIQQMKIPKREKAISPDYIAIIDKML